jgi:hypothetical protein
MGVAVAVIKAAQVLLPVLVVPVMTVQWNISAVLEAKAGAQELPAVMVVWVQAVVGALVDWEVLLE